MNLAEFFHGLDAAAVSALVSEGREEDVFLEFKTVSDARLSQKEDRKNVAKALSGFANSAGGVVLWGVEAKRNAQGIDTASGMRLIEPVALLLSRLNQFAGEFVSPIVPGVQNRAIPTNGTAGIVATLVPESVTGPHMAKAGEDRYFKRSGDSFYRMEHFDIADMFGRRARPDLCLEVTVVRDSIIESSGSKRRYTGKAVLALRNSGRGAAAAPYVSIKLSEPYRRDQFGITGNGHEGLPRLWHSGSPTELSYGGDATRVIHPNTRLEVCAVEVEFGASGACPADLVAQFAVAADGVAARSGELVVRGIAIQQGLIHDDRKSFAFSPASERERR